MNPIQIFAPQETSNALVVGVDGEQGLMRMAKGGAVRSVVKTIRMSEDRGDVYYMSRKKKTRGGGDQWIKIPVLTGMGYKRLNNLLSVNLWGPETQIGESGERVANPYPYRDPQTNEVKAYRVRRVGVGRNGIGNIVAIELTLTYDLELYLAQSLYKQWKGWGSDAQFKTWGKLQSTANVDARDSNNPDKRVVNCPGGVSLVLDLGHRDVVGLFDEHTQRQKFGERIALSIADRNILKTFTGLSILDPSLEVTVVGWENADIDVNSIREALAESDTCGLVELDGRDIEIIRESDTVSDPDEVAAATEGDLDEEMDSEEPPEATPGLDAPDVVNAGESGEVEVSANVLKLRKAARLAFQSLSDSDKAKAQTALGAAGFVDMNWVSQSADEASLYGANAVLEQQVGRAQDAAKSAAGGDAEGREKEQATAPPESPPKPKFGPWGTRLQGLVKAHLDAQTPPVVSANRAGTANAWVHQLSQGVYGGEGMTAVDLCRDEIAAEQMVQFIEKEQKKTVTV